MILYLVKVVFFIRLSSYFVNWVSSHILSWSKNLIFFISLRCCSLLYLLVSLLYFCRCIYYLISSAEFLNPLVVFKASMSSSSNSFMSFSFGITRSTSRSLSCNVIHCHEKKAIFSSLRLNFFCWIMCFRNIQNLEERPPNKMFSISDSLVLLLDFLQTKSIFYLKLSSDILFVSLSLRKVFWYSFLRSRITL